MEASSQFCQLCRHPSPGHYAHCPIVHEQGSQTAPMPLGQSQYEQPPYGVSSTDQEILERLREISQLLWNIRQIAQEILDKQP